MQRSGKDVDTSLLPKIVVIGLLVTAGATRALADDNPPRR
jgi:hypothetical protein